METVRDRLYKFIQHLNMSVRQFEIKWGVASSYVRNISKGIGNDHLTNLCNQYPELDLNWLFTGQGSMLKNISENSENLTQQTITKDRNNSIDELIDIRIEKAVMENLDKIIATIMEGTNKSNQQQNAHVENILKMQSDENAKKFNTLIEAIREIIKDEDRDKFEQKIIPLKTKIG